MKLIKEAQVQLQRKTVAITNITENVNFLAKQEDVQPQEVFESITHVLAGISQTANQMHPRTVAAILAGTEALSQGLMKMSQPENALRVLQNAAMARNDTTNQVLPNQYTTKLAEYGAKFASIMKKYETIVNSPEELQKQANILSSQIQRAMTQLAQNNKPANFSQPDDNNPGQVMR